METPSTSVTMLIEKLDCNCVILKRLSITTLAFASRFKVMTRLAATGRAVVDIADAVEVTGVDQLLDATGDRS